MLTTPRLTLRPVTPADRADLMALEADPEVMFYLNGGRPVPEEGVFNGEYLTPRGTEPEVMAMQDRETGAFLGWIAFFDDGFVEGLRRSEIGYRLHKAAWGKGLATEAAGALIGWAFDHGGFDCVRASTMAVNLGSRRVMEKAGMVHVETTFPPFSDPIPGSDQGEVIYEIRRIPDQAASAANRTGSWCRP
jgi:RimJ/RimL family protein N-acetyltransferase